MAREVSKIILYHADTMMGELLKLTTMAKTKLEETELCLSYCVYRNKEDKDTNFVEEFSTRKEAREYLKKYYFMSQRIRVCASAEYGKGGACEFAYGDTQTEAVKELNRLLKAYGYKAVDLWKR